MLDIAEARQLWEPSAPYLNTASFGLPPKPAWDALQSALEDWHHGRTSWEHWCDATERSREHFGALVNVPAERIATGASVSYLVGLVAASIPDGARVLVPDHDFSSLTWPFLAQAGRRVDVRPVALERIADAIDGDTDVVALSAVQSSNGRVADVGAVAEAAEAHGAFSVVDATQAVGWLPFDASRYDAVACAAYKWLMSPRGTAFLTLSDEALDRITPLAANWFAGDDRFGRYYEPQLRLADDARRLDLSPAWFSWVGAEPALWLLGELTVEKIHEHDLTLANRFRTGLGLPAGDSPIVSIDVPAPRRSSRGPASLRQSGVGRSAPPSTSTTRRRTSTPHSRRSWRDVPLGSLHRHRDLDLRTDRPRPPRLSRDRRPHHGGGAHDSGHGTPVRPRTDPP